jgi:hypothetical protein
VHPQQCGYFRRKVWRDRRSTLPRENPLVFFPRHAAETLYKYSRIAAYAWRLNRKRKRMQRDPAMKTYTDLALTPVVEAADEKLAMFDLNDSSRAAVTKAKAEAARKKKPEAVEAA